MGISESYDEMFSERARYLTNLDEFLLTMHGEQSNESIAGAILEQPFSFGFDGAEYRAGAPFGTKVRQE